MSRRTTFLALMAVMVAVVAFIAPTASASGGAYVVSHGSQPGDFCAITALDGYYEGFLTLVDAPSGHTHLGCVTMLLQGTGVSQLTRITSNGETLTLTPGGVATLSLNQ